MTALEVTSLRKTFRTKRKAAGMSGSMRDLVKPEYSSVEAKPLAHKWVNDGLKRHLLAQRAPLLAKPAKTVEDTLPALVPDVIGEDALWACTTCGNCDEACPIGLEHLPRFFRLRQQRVMMEGAFPHELMPEFDAYESQGNPWGLPVQARGEWARMVPPWASGFAVGEDSLVVLFPTRSPMYPHDTLEDVLRHEVTHVLISRAAGGKRVPWLWLRPGRRRT